MDRLNTFKNIVLVPIVLILASIISAFIGGAISALGGNVELIGLSSISFDPALTIAYIIVYHYLAHFYQVSGKWAYGLFLFAIFLSFTVNFIQGAILMILFFWGLKLLKIVGSPSTT